MQVFLSGRDLGGMECSVSFFPSFAATEWHQGMKIQNEEKFENCISEESHVFLISFQRKRSYATFFRSRSKKPQYFFFCGRRVKGSKIIGVPLLGLVVSEDMMMVMAS